jgi:hypothetical protein
MPARTFKSVDFPAPLEPMIPVKDPRGTSKETSFRASIIFNVLCLRPNRTSADFNVGFLSRLVRYFSPSPCTEMAGPSDADSKLTLLTQK